MWRFNGTSDNKDGFTEIVVDNKYHAGQPILYNFVLLLKRMFRNIPLIWLQLFPKRFEYTN